MTKFGKMSPNAGMDVRKGEQVFAVSGTAKLVYPAMEISEDLPQKARNKSTTSSSYTTAGQLPKDSTISDYRNTHSSMVIAALFPLCRKWKPPRYASTDELNINMLCTFIMEFHSVNKKIKL